MLLLRFEGLCDMCHLQTISSKEDKASKIIPVILGWGQALEVLLGFQINFFHIRCESITCQKTLKTNSNSSGTAIADAVWLDLCFCASPLHF